MNILIITGNPKKENHTRLLATTYQEAAEKAGHTVQLIDVYAPEFILPYVIPEKGSMDEENMRKIATMQGMITWAKEIVVIHPIWWGLMPAGLKNWADAVFVPHFAFAYNPDGSVQKLLTGKTGKVIATAGSYAPYYSLPIISFFTPLHIIWKYALFGFFGITLVEMLVQDKMNTHDSCPPVGCLEAFEKKVAQSATRH